MVLGNVEETVTTVEVDEETMEEIVRVCTHTHTHTNLSQPSNNKTKKLKHPADR